MPNEQVGRNLLLADQFQGTGGIGKWGGADQPPLNRFRTGIDRSLQQGMVKDRLAENGN